MSTPIHDPLLNKPNGDVGVNSSAPGASPAAVFDGANGHTKQHTTFGESSQKPFTVVNVAANGSTGDGIVEACK